MMAPSPLILLSRLACLSALVFSASCAMQGPSGPAGPTQYLEAFAPQSLPTSDTFMTDNVSHWDGEGMSGSPSVVIDLSDQKAYFYKGGRLAGVSALSTGDAKHRTPSGTFKIIEKDKWHKSNLYGDYVDGAGNVVMKDIDVTKDPKPPGTRFDGSKMTHFMRFTGGIGMHEGFLPGYPASHGCVRMPGHMAETYFHNVSLGTPVTVRP
jgi:lipoprotein-anchoring transpeptidase ErfK/SrfK